jgi:hypothetical protein
LVKLLTGLNGVLAIGFNHLIVYPIYRPSNRSSLTIYSNGGEGVIFWAGLGLQHGLETPEAAGAGA